MIEDKYDGDEKRKAFRRASDKVCALHELLWDHHDSSTKEHRELVCMKITRIESMLSGKADTSDIQELKGDIKVMVPWKALTTIFAILFVLVTGAITITGWFISRDQRLIESSVSRGNTEVKEAISTLHRRITDADRVRQDSIDGLKEKIGTMNNAIDRVGDRLTVVEDRLRIRPPDTRNTDVRR